MRKQKRPRGSDESSLSAAGALVELREYFKRNGCVRQQSAKRLAREGYLGYKKGDEVRLTARDEQELKRLQDLLSRAGFRNGRPYAKRSQHIIPIYGRELVRKFLIMVGSAD